mgnify:CR=1 FL=1
MYRVFTALSAMLLLALSSGSQAAGHCDSETRADQGCVVLHTVVLDDLELAHPWTRVMQPGQPVGGGYIAISNHGEAADRLVHASTRRAARTEIHSMSVVDDVMTMRPVEGGLEIPAGGTVELKPGSYHIMFMDVAAPFAEGDTVAVTLQFEKAGAVELNLPVRAMQGAGGHGHGHGQNH